MRPRLHARLGNASDCERALLAASGASEQADHARDPDWIASPAQPYLLGQFGTCYLDLGRPPARSATSAKPSAGTGPTSFAAVPWAPPCSLDPSWTKASCRRRATWASRPSL